MNLMQKPDNLYTPLSHPDTTKIKMSMVSNTGEVDFIEYWSQHLSQSLVS